jgi:hypothetical protein
LFILLPGIGSSAQVIPTPKYLDPTRDPSTLRPAPTTSLAEQFIWTADDAAALNPAYQATVRGQNDKTAPHTFRAHFEVKEVPPQATMYVAGPRSATVFLNGKKVLRFDDDPKAGRGFHVKTANVAEALDRGENVIAIQEVRGHNSLHTGAAPIMNQVTYGEVLLVKIVPRGIAENAPPLLISDTHWRSTLHPGDDWRSPSLDDSGWPQVESIGSPGGRKDFMQWNMDAGLYDWPGYSGILPYLRTFRLSAIAFADIPAQNDPPKFQPISQPQAPVALAPKRDIILDFGREIAGRVHLASSANEPVRVQTSYGESAEEALHAPYLGVRIVTVPPHGEAFGPKSAFRYVRVSAPEMPSVELSTADVQGIVYPVEYKGSFESSDPLLNRVWETGAYTAHLCMQDDIWDGVKRDRARWMGDLDVSGRVINDVFAERDLMESTMTALAGDEPVVRPINTIAGYSAFWITGQADFYRHTGDLAYLRGQHQHLLEVLRVMDSDLDSNGLLTNPEKHKIFIDWAPGFNSDAPEARAATQFEYALAYTEAAYLLTELGNKAAAVTYSSKADCLRATAQANLLDAATSTFGSRWQTNAMAVLAGAATKPQQQAIWTAVLSHVLTPEGPDTVITPYYGYYVLSAMAALNHRTTALDWIRKYWGGMIAEGATSFWEAYDPRWPKQDSHAHLQADNKTGYYVSLAHGWSSGPTAWLMEQVLGIQPTTAGFRTVSIRPDLAGLAWARGAEPTPRGLIRVDLQGDKVHLTLPPNTVANVSLPFATNQGRVFQNGRAVSAASAEGGSRSIVTLQNRGEYTFTAIAAGGRR